MVITECYSCMSHDIIFDDRSQYVCTECGYVIDQYPKYFTKFTYGHSYNLNDYLDVNINSSIIGDFPRDQMKNKMLKQRHVFININVMNETSGGTRRYPHTEVYRQIKAVCDRIGCNIEFANEIFHIYKEYLKQEVMIHGPYYIPYYIVALIFYVSRIQERSISLDNIIDEWDESIFKDGGLKRAFKQRLEHVKELLNGKLTKISWYDKIKNHIVYSMQKLNFNNENIIIVIKFWSEIYDIIKSKSMTIRTKSKESHVAALIYLAMETRRIQAPDEYKRYKNISKAQIARQFGTSPRTLYERIAMYEKYCYSIIYPEDN